MLSIVLILIYGFSRRKKAAEVRYPRFVVHSQDYYYSLLLMLLPHRHENDILHGYQTPQEAFENMHDSLDKSVDFTYFSFTTDIENAMLTINCIREEENAQLEVDECGDMEGDETGVFSGMPVDTDHENHSNVPADTNLGSANQDMGNNHNNHDIPDFDSDLLSVHVLICRMSLDEMHVAARGLTECQHKVFSFVVEQMNLDESTHIFISGGGGVGKSFLVDLIISWIDFYKVVVPGKRPVVVCAPTGTAARHAKGRTIHSPLKLPVTQFLEYVPLHPKVLQRVVDDFIGVHTVVIDEISMVSASMLSVISSRLSEITDCSLPFGGLNMIVVGDFFQLRPVCGRPALKNEILWNLFTPLFLHTNVRQCKDPRYGRLLNRARLGHLLPDDIDLLKTRLISIESEDVLDALHIFPTRDLVRQYNEKRQGMIDQPLVSLSAHHFF